MVRQIYILVVVCLLNHIRKQAKICFKELKLIAIAARALLGRSTFVGLEVKLIAFFTSGKPCLYSGLLMVTIGIRSNLTFLL